MQIPNNFVSLHRFLTAPALLACSHRDASNRLKPLRLSKNAEAQGWRPRDGNLYIGKALLDALCLTFRNLAVPKTFVKHQSNNDVHGYVVSDK